MKNLYYFGLVFLILSSCKSLNISNLHNGSILEQKLPPLEPDFDIDSFGPDYADLYDIPNIILRGGIEPENVVRNVTTEMTIAEDTRRLFDREVIFNISELTGKTKGYAVCRKGARSKGIKSYVHPTISIITLGLANLFGMTAVEYTDELEIIIDIYNLDNEIVGSYAGLGKGSAKMKMYTGYSKRGAKRMAHGRAFVQTLEDIKFQIREDHQKLVDLLLNDEEIITDQG